MKSTSCATYPARRFGIQTKHIVSILISASAISISHADQEANFHHSPVSEWRPSPVSQAFRNTPTQPYDFDDVSTAPTSDAASGTDTGDGSLASAQALSTTAREPNLSFTLTPGTGRISAALSEFAHQNDWEIAWEIDRDFPIDYPARFEGPFLGIIEAVVMSLRMTDAPVRAKVYSANKVIRIIHATR